MEETCKEKVALITGASHGIGKAIAQRFAVEGIKVILCSRSENSLREVVNEIESDGGQAKYIACDLSREEDIQSLIKKAVSCWNRLDILVNNAGIGLNKPLEQSTDEEWKHLFQLNAFAPFSLCRDSIKELKKSDWGTIINIGSVVGIKGYKHQSLYASSKHALMGMTKVLAQEIQDEGIRVHAINPGGVYTDMAQQMRPDLNPEGLITPQEIAEIVWFLISQRGNAMIDDIHIRRANGTPWY